MILCRHAASCHPSPRSADQSAWQDGAIDETTRQLRARILHASNPPHHEWRPSSRRGIELAPGPRRRVYIDAKGDDTWSGTLAAPNADRTEGPRASLAGAQDAVRALKARGPRAVRVRIAGGLY